MSSTGTRIPEILAKRGQEILEEWILLQMSATTSRSLLDENQIRADSKNFLDLLLRSMREDGAIDGLSSGTWDEMRDLLGELSRARARQGFTPSETASVIFALKQPLFAGLRRDVGAADADALARETWLATRLLDNLGLITVEAFVQGRDEVIGRQQRELMELSTPVVELWDGILALPLIGTLDSARTQVMMESLLQMIVQTGASIAIIEITGVPTVDSMVAQHLLKTVAAARLMGADCMISGIRPQIAQTIVHLGLDLSDVITKATLADAFATALERSGITITRSAKIKSARSS